MSSKRESHYNPGRGRGRGRGRGDGDRDRPGFALRCFHCQELGHRKHECPQLSRPGRPSGGDSYSSYRSTPRSETRSRSDDEPIATSSRHVSPRFAQSTGQEFASHSGHYQSSRHENIGPHLQKLSLKTPSPDSGHHSGYSSPKRSRNKIPEPIRVEERVCKAKPQFVGRPGVGKRGQLMDLIANHFRLVIKDITVYHYHIDIACDDKPRLPEIRSKASTSTQQSKNKMRKLRQKDNRIVFEELVQKNPQLFCDTQSNKAIKQPVFDGSSNVYTALPLSKEHFEGSVELQLDGKKNKVLVTLKKVQEIDLSQINLYYDGHINEVPREAMQAIDIILRHGPTTNRIPIGNCLYPKWDPKVPRTRIDDTGNKQLAFGHYQSTRLTKVGPTLLVDRTATAFYSGGSLLEYLTKLLNERDFDFRRNRRALDQIRTELKGLRIYTTHLSYKRSYTIKDLSQGSPNEQEFEFEKDGKVSLISVKDYFKDVYKINIENKELPCVIPQGSKQIFLPLELCHLYPDQPIPKSKITPQNTMLMVRTCGSQMPSQRFEEIYESVDNIRADSKNYLKEFRIDIDDKPLIVPGRVLNRPDTQGLNRELGEKIHKSIRLENWVFVNLNKDFVNSYMTQRFIEGLIGFAADTVGMTVSKPVKRWEPDVSIYKIDKEYISKLFTGAKQECKTLKGGLQMILFIIPDDTRIYTNIKLEGDINHGIVTQCVKAKNVAKPPKGGVQANLLLKINAKLGGINRILKDLPDRPSVLNNQVMIIGADVTHPAPADKLESSVAACIGSYDKNHCVYSASIRVQEKSTKAQAIEMIKEFDVMIKDLLHVYHRENEKNYPKHIIYYRDGVSESQFEQVLDHEYKKLLEGCEALGFKPKVTFITVQKRHHTRFRPKDDRSRLVGRKGNVPAGTTVDTHVVHPTDFDFYLCSHDGIQGTSRPTHYYVLHDDHNFEADELQKLTYYLCYTYARCDKPISIPSPVQYAHLAAYRARNHIIACNLRAEKYDRNETEEERKNRERRLAKKLNDNIKVNEGVKNRMYYC